MYVIKIKEHGLQRVDPDEGSELNYSNSSIYTSSIENRNLESVFGSNNSMGDRYMNNDKDETISAKKNQWSAATSVSMSISPSSDPSSVFKSVSSDYSSGYGDDVAGSSSNSLEQERHSLYYLRADKDVLEVSPAVSTYSRSASIDEWSLSPANRASMYTYSAHIDISSDGLFRIEECSKREISPLRAVSLRSDIGIADSPDRCQSKE